MADARQYIGAIAKHLPPSAATLRLLDVGGAAGMILAGLRDDLDIAAVTGSPTDWNLSSDSMDAVVAYDYSASPEFLSASLAALRPGGRLVVANPHDAVSAAWVKMLENAGYTRILVEALSDGVLIRGEKPHTEQRPQDRIQQVSSRDSNSLDFATYSGRYVYLLVRQTPNQPVWKLASGEQVEWQAVAVEGDDSPVLLAFSSLPKAVAFMQPAVMAGRIKDVNKIAKFSRETAQQWMCPLILNPTTEALEKGAVVLVPVDPETAEASDE